MGKWSMKQLLQGLLLEMIGVAGNQKLRRKHKFMVEAVGLRDVLTMARKQGYRCICVEGNSMLVIDAIEGRSIVSWRIRSIIVNITAASFQNIYLDWHWGFKRVLAMCAGNRIEIKCSRDFA